MSQWLRVVVLSQVAVLLGGSALWSADVKKGESLYAAKCASCHGKDLKGNAAMTKVFKLDASALSLVSQSALAKTDEDLTAVTAKGKGKMPAQEGKLKAEEIADIIAYVRSVGGGAEKAK